MKNLLIILASMFLFGFSPTSTSFNSGQVSPLMEARTDFPKYGSSCRTVENMLVNVHGSAIRRPGSYFVAETEDSVASRHPVVIPDPAKTQIYTPQDLQDMNLDRQGDYELMNNLDMTGFEWIPIGINATGSDQFIGTFNGNMFTISNLTIDRSITSTWSGLFGNVRIATLENVVITGTATVPEGSFPRNFFGMLAGDASSCVISRVHVTYVLSTDTAQETFSPNAYGGLVGSANGTTSISQCGVVVTMTGTARAYSRFGGLIGEYESPLSVPLIDNSYCVGIIDASSTLSGLSRCGGFIGDTEQALAITNCYSAIVLSGDTSINVGGFIGEISGITPNVYSDCFWDGDIDTKNLDDIGNLGDVAGITESTTGAMYQQATYTNWNFGSIWQIEEGSGYPRLQWYVQALKWYNGSVTGSTEQAKLMPFEFSTADTYVIEAGTGYMRFYRDDE